MNQPYLSSFSSSQHLLHTLERESQVPGWRLLRFLDKAVQQHHAFPRHAVFEALSPMTITSYSFIVALTEHLLCAAWLVWRLLRASSRPVARPCRRRTTPTNGASGLLVRTRHDAAPSHAKALSASRHPNCRVHVRASVSCPP